METGNIPNKGRSPFFPGQPVPVELFVGRASEIDRISRAATQVKLGKQQAIFIEGEYGIGKSSLARFVRIIQESTNSIFGLHILLANAKDSSDVANETVKSMLQSRPFKPKASENLRSMLSKYVGDQELFKIKIRLSELRIDSPDIAKGYLPFLRDAYDRVKSEGYQGLMLIFDEINGITANPEFARFIKGLIDSNALSDDILPLFVILCGIQERRKEMISCHKPVERIFDVVEIQNLSDSEAREFYIKAFKEVSIDITDEAIQLLVKYSGGLPRLMHILGDNAFWADKDGEISSEDALDSILMSAVDVGRKFVDPQVFRALKSPTYKRILKKLGTLEFDLSFQKKDIEKGLNLEERKRLGNFLTKMKKLKVLSSGEEKGVYVFCDRLTRLYVRMESVRKRPS